VGFDRLTSLGLDFRTTLLLAVGPKQRLSPEVRAYIRKLERTQTVTCDDGTPLDKLGAT
jgi:hypothetical protein